MQTGGPIASTTNPGPTYEVNSDIILPNRGTGLQGNKPITMKNVKKASKLELIRKRNICKDEVCLLCLSSETSLIA